MKAEVGASEARWLTIAVGIPLTRYPPHREAVDLISQGYFEGNEVLFADARRPALTRVRSVAGGNPMALRPGNLDLKVISCQAILVESEESRQPDGWSEPVPCVWRKLHTE